MLCFEHLQPGFDIGRELGGALDQAKPLHLVDGGDGGGERHGMSFVGVAVGEVVILKVGGDLLVRRAQAERHVGSGDALGGGEDVGRNAPVLHGEPLSGAAPAGHDLVGDEQDSGLIADAAELGHVLVRRHDDAVGADDRLDDDGGYVGLIADDVLEVVGAGDVAAGVGVADGAAIAVDFRAEEGALLLASDGLHGPAARVSGGCDGAGGGPVIALVAREDFGFAGVHAGDFEGGLVGVGAAGGEEEVA